MKKPEIHWMIYNPDFGLYVDTALTKKGMIFGHCADKNKTWKECKKDGDMAVQVKITILSKV